MMMKWYATAAHDPYATSLSKYFLAETATQKFSDDGVFLRAPAPELLVGSPTSTLTVIARQTFKNRFAAVTLSFAPDEINVVEFNDGGASRQKVAHAINVFLECVFPGIAVMARPPVMVATHVHTGRLELNILVPKAVLTSGGYRSYNPCPPGSKTQKRWDLVTAFLCSAFGWRDPNDVLNRRLVTHPDWVLKRRAEQIRLGTFDEAELRWVIERSAMKAYHAGADCRDSLLAELVPILEAHRYHIATTGARSVTFKPDRGAKGESIQLKGLLFCSGHFLDAIGSYGADPHPDARKQDLGTDLARALAATARQNRSRFGFASTSAPDPDPFALFQRPPRPLPPRHPSTAVVGYEAKGRPDKGRDGSARRLGSPLGMTLVRTLTSLLSRLIRASADHLVASLITTSPFANMKPTVDRWSQINARFSSLVARRNDRLAAGPAATGVPSGSIGAVPGHTLRRNAEPEIGANQQRPADTLGSDREAYRLGRNALGHVGIPGRDARKVGSHGPQVGSLGAGPATDASVAAMRPKTTDTLSSISVAAMVEATNNPSKDHASEIETDDAVNVTVKQGLLGEVIPPETIPDFLEPMTMSFCRATFRGSPR